MNVPSSALTILFIATLAAGCSRETAEPRPGDVVTVSDTLIDTHCYASDHANLKMDHDRPEGHVPGCGAICAREGFPVGLLIDGVRDAQVWVLVTSPPVLADYMSRTVRIRGEVRSKGVLIPQRIELENQDGWTYIL